MVESLDWSWNDTGVRKGLKKAKIKNQKQTKSQRKRQKKRDKLNLSKGLLPKDFYRSDEWRRLRYRVLRKYKGACMLCGRTRRQHNVILHVDHIKPKSKHPHLALVFDNLQILCEDCNLGKSNKDDFDWRPEDMEETKRLDVELIAEISKYQ